MSGCDHSTAPRRAPERGGDAVEAARIAYRAYGDRTGWRNFRGDPMPRWQDLGEVIQDAWRAAAAAVAEHVAGHVAERDAAPAGQTTGGEVTR